MPEACFKRWFAVESDLNWLKLKAANGLEIPHVGYILAEVQVGDITLKDMGIVISKDDPNNPNALPILGMNVIALCWDMLFSKPQIQITTWPVGSTVNTQQAWAGFSRLSENCCSCTTGGTLRPAYRHPEVVPGDSELLAQWSNGCYYRCNLKIWYPHRGWVKEHGLRL
ncbi:unnamed protein product [Oreochromis niloticus]|nr:unnamed protein product [Mustela putorius furo]